MVAGSGRDAWRARFGLGRVELSGDGALIAADEDAQRILPAARPGEDASFFSALARRVPDDGRPLQMTVTVTNAEAPMCVRVVASRSEAGGEPCIEVLVLDLGPAPEEPDSHFRQVYERAPVAMHSIDELGRLCGVNRAWLELTGYRRDQVLGQDMSVLLTEESARTAEDALPRFWRDGWARGVPYQFVCADGSVIDVEVDCEVTVEPSGRRVSISVVRDVTERQWALQALEERERDLRRLLECSVDAILLHREGNVVWANDRAADLLNAEAASELAGQRLPSSLLASTTLAESSVLHEVRFHKMGGGERVLEVAHLSVHFEGRDTGLLIARDLTDRRALQTKLAQADRLAAVGTLAASVAHEINSPLTYVIHFVDHLQQRLSDLTTTADALGEAGRAIAKELRALEEGAAAAGDGCSRVREIVRDLKTFSRVEDAPPTRIDLNSALRSAIQMSSHQLCTRARLETDFGTLPPVRAHDGRLCQVFSNILLNAAQAIDPADQREDPQIRVETWSDGQWVYASISDTGPGIDVDHLPRLFEPFFSTKPRGVGSGLGLWISRELVRELGGFIDVDTEAGRGSTFTVALPAIGRAIRRQGRKPELMESGQWPSRRILVVDDEQALCELLAEALVERAQVVTASSGEAAREVIEIDERFDAILCDLVMPGMDGAEFFEWVNSTRPELAQRIIFMTGAACTKEMDALLTRVDNDRLYKPFGVRDVERALARLLGPAMRIHA